MADYWDLNESGDAVWVGHSREAMQRCAERCERGDYRLICTERGGRWVSTIFLWIDHSWGQATPILFETAMKDPVGSVKVLERYATRAEANAGHEKWCRVYELDEVAKDAKSG